MKVSASLATITTSIAALVFTLTLPSIANAYTIYLKNGKVINDVSIVTPRGHYVYFLLEGKEEDLMKVKASAVERIETNTGRLLSYPRGDSPGTSTISKGKAEGRAQWRANPIARVPRSRAKADIKGALAKRHPDRYSIQKTFLDDNMKSYDQLAQLPSNNVSDRILIDLKSRHYPNFSVIKTLYIENMKAHKKLNE